MGIYKYLVKKGVYIIKQDKRYSLSKVLTDITNKEEFYKWIDKELITALTEVKLIIIITLQD